jgi:multiple sugar transport system permease protein
VPVWRMPDGYAFFNEFLRCSGGGGMKTTGKNVVRYNRWGYFFLIPFVLVYVVFQLIPLVSTIYNSFFEHYFKNGLTEVGPTFVGLSNYAKLFSGGDLFKYFGNTMIMWLIGFIPQIIVSLLLAAWFSDPSLRLKGTPFFQTVIYMPNLIMASAFSMLFFALFSDIGPINSMLQNMGVIDEAYKFF